MSLLLNSQKLRHSTILGVFVIALSYCAYATSPTSLTNKASLRDNLAVSDNWFICEAIDTQPSDSIEKHIKGATEFACLDHDKATKFVAGHKVSQGEKYLIFDRNADFILLPDYSIAHTEKQPPDNMISASSLGKTSGGLRVTNIQIGTLSEEYVMVPHDWASSRKDFSDVGAVKVDYSITLPCGIDNCDPKAIAYFLVPKREVMKEKELN